jgi:BON domain
LLRWPTAQAELIETNNSRDIQAMTQHERSNSAFLPHDFLFADRQLERRLVNFFVRQGRPDLCKLRIRAQAGKVRFRGQVATAADRDYVLQSARHVAGVLAVEDAIQVGSAQRPIARPRLNNVPLPVDALLPARVSA